ncbi:hypothetical protein RJ639_038358 [Escallonia herrerae]|uniref:Phytosulfokine n=1 Tax=Escallonia herrerae TaxID=1293975 RepID=A0AA88WRV6_9ASTE|nr:hypothetical protein RJ639_038358 [Escallonia herrerae]
MLCVLSERIRHRRAREAPSALSAAVADETQLALGRHTLTQNPPTPETLEKQADDDGAEAKKITEEGGCEGVEKTEECLVRKTLEAHVDYIYTQDHPPKPPHKP